MSKNILQQITDGRTDLVFDYVTAGHAATSADEGGVSLLQWCSYYGDVSAIKFLLATESHSNPWEDSTTSTRLLFMDIRAYASSDRARCGGNNPQPDTGETPLHAALCTTNRQKHDLVIEVLLPRRESQLRDQHQLERITSCVISEPERKRHCTEQRLSARKQPSRCCWMQVH